MDADLKKAKELFILNTHGTTLIDIFSTATLSVLCCVLSIGFRLIYIQNRLHWFLDLCIDNVLIVIPMVLFFTVFSNFNCLSVVILLISVLILLYLYTEKKSFMTILNFIKEMDTGDFHYISIYKANIQIATAVCILAVDFNVFPRRFAKADVFGIGVMDCAVGSIIFSTAMTSSFVRQSNKLNVQILIKTFKSSIFLLALGIFRVTLIKIANYQENISEYGVHWNFFITLAFVKIFASVILYILPFLLKQTCLVMISFGIIIIYQTMLSSFGLASIIQSGFNGDNQRVSFIDANREGICSTLGYISIYFFGIFFGKQLIKTKYKAINKVCWLGLWFFIGCTLTNILGYLSMPISRQMANLSYFCFQISFNAFLLLGFLIVDIVTFAIINVKKKRRNEITNYNIPLLYKVVNQNLLVYFLLANVMTGAINFYVQTLDQPYSTSLLIIYTYMFLLNILTTALYIIFRF
ncbi:phosphatidylinositol-glycan biosynthesis class W protein [Hydra vulgaris]|uniref:phosphatidylinositol-glycan biosynthesis class W protein n=1 Tax=Hydra vulgaris TaxID=6087 RepID=UPI001F5F3FD4|nr:phosphatidylinositol-glycan biosynthesis class W protein [Hydra vulgaris]